MRAPGFDDHGKPAHGLFCGLGETEDAFPADFAGRDRRRRPEHTKRRDGCLRLQDVPFASALADKGSSLPAAGAGGCTAYCKPAAVRLENAMVKIAVLDDWQDVARVQAPTGLPSLARAELTFFPDAFATEDEAAVALADYQNSVDDARTHCVSRKPHPASSQAAHDQHNRRLGRDAGRRGVRPPGRLRVQHRGRPIRRPYATAELALGLLIAAARSIAGRRCGDPRRRLSTWGARGHEPRREDTRRCRARPARDSHGPLRRRARHEGHRVESRTSPKPRRGTPAPASWKSQTSWPSPTPSRYTWSYRREVAA